MMRDLINKLFAFLSMITMLLYFNTSSFSYLLFKFNQSSLIEYFCEKRTDECNACCYLDKKINNDSEKNKEATPNSNQTEDFSRSILFYQNSLSSNHLYDTGHKFSYYSTQKNPLFGYPDDIDNPPKI